jgi:hypothetical protein
MADIKIELSRFGYFELKKKSIRYTWTKTNKTKNTTQKNYNAEEHGHHQNRG